MRWFLFTASLGLIFWVVPHDGVLAESKPAGKVVRIRLGTMAPEGSPWMESLNLMKRRIEEKGGGRIKFQIFPGGQLGDEIQMSESTQFGSLECAGVSTGALANLLPSLNVFEIPFFWKSREEAYYVIDHNFREYFYRELGKVGLELIGWSENGWRHFFTKKKPIRTPDDLKGLRMRSQESPIHLQFWQSLGVNPIPLPTTDIYSALERGIIDGGDNTLVLIAATGWIEVIQYITLTAHIYQPAVLACNKKFWSQLDPEISRIVSEEMRNIEGDLRDRLLKADRDLRGQFETMGKTLIQLKEAELKLFIDRAGKVKNNPEVRKIIGEEVLAIAERGKSEYSSRDPKKN
jgi:tripartite ATP-independent transporter DctP family solute receptor